MQITNTVGHVYDVVSVSDFIYRVADKNTKKIKGYVASANYGHISVYGPLASTPIMAQMLANRCAYNRYRSGYCDSAKVR